MLYDGLRYSVRSIFVDKTTVDVLVINLNVRIPDDGLVERQRFLFVAEREAEGVCGGGIEFVDAEAPRPNTAGLVARYSCLN